MPSPKSPLPFKSIQLPPVSDSTRSSSSFKLPPFEDYQNPTSVFHQQFSSASWLNNFLSSNLCPVFTAPQDPADASPWTFMRSTMITGSAIVAQKSFLAYAGQLCPPHSVCDVGTLVTLFRFGKGSEGHPGLAHGGFMAAVLDQEMGSMVRLDPGNREPLSVRLEVGYKAKMEVPGVYVCKSWIVKREGKKLWLEAVLQDGWEEWDRRVLATAKSLFVVNVPVQKQFSEGQGPSAKL